MKEGYSSDALDRAKLLVEFISNELDGVQFDGNVRSALVGSYLNIATDHHAGIILLVVSGLIAPPFALLRPLMETYVRGLWIGYCATDETVERLVREEKFDPKIGQMIADLEKLEAFSAGALRGSWDSQNTILHDYTHGGIALLSTAYKSDEISRHLDPGVMDSALHFANAIAVLAAQSMAILANDEAMAIKIRDFAKTHVAA